MSVHGRSRAAHVQDRILVTCGEIQPHSFGITTISVLSSYGAGRLLLISATLPCMLPV
jgi:hypothetical protein